MSNRKIKMIPLANLLPYGKNARTQSDAQIELIAARLGEFGWKASGFAGGFLLPNPQP